MPLLVSSSKLYPESGILPLLLLAFSFLWNKSDVSNTQSLVLLLNWIGLSNCSAPNLAPTPAELCKWTAVWGSIIINNPTLIQLLSTLLSRDSQLLLRPTEKFNYSAPK